MFVTPSASGATSADAGFVDFGQRAFEGGPEWQELLQEAVLERGNFHFLLHEREYSMVTYA
jgi:hypothetical protein